MGAGRGDVRSMGLQVRSESGVFRIIRDLGSNALPAVPEAVASPFISRMWTWWVSRSSSAPVSRSEPKTSVHSSMGRLVVTRIEPLS